MIIVWQCCEIKVSHCIRPYRTSAARLMPPSIVHCWRESKRCIRECRKFKVLASPRETESEEKRGGNKLHWELHADQRVVVWQVSMLTATRRWNLYTVLRFDRPCSWLSGEWVSRSMQLWIWNIKYTVFFFPALFGEDWVHFQTSQRMNTHTTFHCDLLIFKIIFAWLF